MNAALEQGGTSEQKRFPHASLRQAAVATTVLLLASAAAAFTFSKVIAAPASYAGSIESVGSVDLNFNVTGELARLEVKPGDHVTKGQLLATEDQTVADANLQGARAILAAQQLSLTHLQDGTITGAQQHQLALQVDQVTAQLANAEQAAKDASNVASAQLTQAQGALAGAQSSLSQDQAAYSGACPGGVPPMPVVSGSSGPEATATRPAAPLFGMRSMTGAGTPWNPASANTPSPAPNAVSLPVAQLQMTQVVQCLSLQAQVQKDVVGANAAQANLTQVASIGQQLQDASRGAATVAQIALQLSQNATAVATSSSPADVDAARVAVAQAQAQVLADEATLHEAELVSPVTGVVTQVGGAVGDLVGPTGVHNFTGPSSPASTSHPSFSLFPPPAGANSANGSNSGDVQSLVSIQGSETEAVAQVSEDRAATLHPGQTARITVNALGASFDGEVVKVVPVPIHTSSSVAYAVRLTARSWPSEMLSGMSISVTFQ